MNKVETIKNFNAILGNFLVQVTPIIGTTYNYYFNQIITTNALLPIQYFIIYVHNSEKPLAEYIKNKDEYYFTNTDDHKKHLSESIYADTGLMEIIRLRGIYSKLTDESKANVWNILQALFQLSNEYLELQ